MTNGELFTRENPNIKVKINGTCVWIYFDGVNYYTMPVSWWNKEIKMLEEIKADFEKKYPRNIFGDFEGGGNSVWFSLNNVKNIIDKHIGKEQE